MKETIIHTAGTMQEWRYLPDMKLNPTLAPTNPGLDIFFGPKLLANVPERFIGR
jgi:hypothetical protein